MPVSISGAGSISGLDQGFNVTTGSVGIGTDNPGLTAHIYSTAATDVALIESTQNFATLRFKSALNSSGPTIGIDGAGGLQLDQKDTSKYISFAIGSERLRIDSSGNLLLKTGEIDIQGGNKTVKTSAGFLQVGTSGSHYLSLITAGLQRLNITSAGDMGLGTASPRSITNFGSFAINGTAGAFTDYFLNGTRTGTTAVDSNGFTSEAVGSSTPFRVITNGLERLRITSAGTLESYSPDDTTPNIKWRSNDTNWFGALNQSVEGGTITSFLSCGGDWSANGTTYSATKALAAYPTSAIAIHNQYNSTWGSEFVFLTKAGGSSTTDGAVTERLRITSAGKVGIGTDNPQYSLDLGESSSTIRLVSENNGTAIRIGAGGGGNDVSLIRVDGSAVNDVYGESDNSTYGFSLKYMGSRSGNSNSLSIFADNQTGTQFEALTILQDGSFGIKNTSPDTTLHIKSPAQNDTHGILKVESTSTGTGPQTNAGIIAKNRYGWSQFMQWEENGLRVGSRSTSTGGEGKVTVTYGSDSTGAVINENGVVTMPQQCGFHVVLHTSQTLTNNGTVNLWDTDASDSRSYIKNMTFNAGRFVAPVSGLYYFTAQLLLSGVGNSDDAIHIAWTTGSGNDTFAYWNTRHDGASANGSYGYGGYLPVTGSTTVYLSANEIFGIRANFTGGIGIHGTDANWGHWSGFLVG